MSRDKPPSFQFYPRDFTSSQAVRAMSPEARGGYIMLLCQAWLAEEPGVLEDDDELLAALSELGPRWQECRVSIRRAFAERSPNGRRILVQERMVAEREAQLVHREISRKGAAATNAKRWSYVASDNSGDRSTVAERRPASASASAQSKEKALRMRAHDETQQPEPVPEILPAGPSWTWDQQTKAALADDRPGELCDPESARAAREALEAELGAVDEGKSLSGQPRANGEDWIESDQWES